MKKIVYICTIGASWILLGCSGGGSVSATSTASNDTNTSEDTNTSTNEEIQDVTPPVIISADNVSIPENHTQIMNIVATDESIVRYYIVGGDDASLFHVSYKKGTLVWKIGADYENALDKDRDNVYQIRVKAVDIYGNRAYQDINITVTDINESNSGDTDDDGIPDNIEVLLDMNSSNDDQDNNGIVDGRQSSGDIGDQFFNMQWHLWDYEARATNNSGVDTKGIEFETDLNVMDIYHKYMGYNEGDPIIVQVVDTGVDADHEDLIENMDLSRSYDGNKVGDPSGYGVHGTMVAGIMASRAFNGKGVRGIAPFARIAGSNWLEDQTVEALELAWTEDEKIAITNNSWGAYQMSETIFEDFMEYGVTHGREGKGRIYTFAAGNSRGDHGDANLEYMLSNRFPIVVAALKNDNTYASYSNPGSNLWVSGYSGDYYQTTPTIGTTTIMGRSTNSGDINTQTTWSEDTKENYTFAMNGTSSAAPTVAGSIALVLEACPDLNWRDVKYIAAKTAKKIDDETDSNNWVVNSAGFHHSIDYGFGRIDAKAMIDECTNGYTNLPDELNITVSKTFNELVEDNKSKDFIVSVDENITIEWVEVTITNDHVRASEYEINLTSPSNTKTVLIKPGVETSGSWMSGGWRFATAAMLGEGSKGDWNITISDTNDSGDTGTVSNININIYGH